jgi:hypothetical protein
MTTVLVAACASSPREPSESVAATSQATQATATAAPTSVVDSNGVLVVNTADQNLGSIVECRQMLKQGSNVIVRRCMTRDDWVKFKRQEEREAAAIVRVLQGGAYR